MRIIWRLLAFLRPFWGWVVLSVILSAATFFAGIGLLGTSADLIARAALQPGIAALQVSIVGVRFFGISRAVLRYLERLVSHSVNFRLLAQLRVWFYKRLEPLSPARLQDYRSGDVLQRAIGDIETLENFYVRVLAPPLSAILITAGMGWFVGQVDWRLGLVLAGGLLAGGAGISLLAFWIGQKAGAAYVQDRAQLNAEMVSVIQGITDLVAYSQELIVKQRVEHLLEVTSRSQRRLVLGNGLVNGLMVALTNLTLVLVLWFAIPLVEGGALEGYRLAVLAVLTLASFEAVNSLPQAAQLLRGNVESAARLFELSDQTPAVVEPVCPVKVPESQTPRLSINHLTFRYADRSMPTLNDISLSLTPPKKIAIVGESGAGKSTIIQLLLRYWEYEKGEILLNGVDYKNLDSRDIRRFFGVVSATPYLFSATLRQNLLIARPDADKQQLLTIIERVGLKNWLDSLPNGLDTWVGEHGKLMSGGERQRLAAGRALLSNAPFILLDEPTSGLDSLSELQLMQTLFNLFRERSILWVTHRLIDMEQMDEIIVLQAGQVIERGKHNRLLAAGGIYAGLWQGQQRIFWD
ncbi:MAG TPA: thiol reductant ABC exporter subunit CydC, partial [Anaerolineaceae bacterium]|nr:thiol reductant ABC exporter subunit CydC [Anaerolineaceae bacterium]